MEKENLGMSFIDVVIIASASRSCFSVVLVGSFVMCDEESFELILDDVVFSTLAVVTVRCKLLASHCVLFWLVRMIG